MNFTTDANGRMVATTVPKATPPPIQKITGSIAQAAAQKTTTDAANAAAAAKALGAGQKGAGRRRKYTGGAEQNVTPPPLPTANSVAGANAGDVLKKLVDAHTQIKASSTYDSLAKAPPIKVGGFRLIGAEDLYPGSGTQTDTKRRRKTKKKNGRHHKRTHRRKRSKSRAVRRRSRRAV
uniref:Uncharacterized protein n=1 Tax=viral metagenome TaxID=1070528 RepID=A0A6C0CGW7_9ZZZZ